MVALNELTTNKTKRKRVGRGTGSGKGKTSCRGQKGAGSRSGYKRRLGKEGGRLPLYMKLPTKGFTRGRFLKEDISLTFDMIERVYQDGETVNRETLYEKGIIRKELSGKVKLLNTGRLTKKLTIEVDAYSKQAAAELEKMSIKFSKTKSE